MRRKSRAIYRYLRGLREERALTLRAASKLTGLSYSYLNEIENGKKNPTADALLKIAKAYSVSPMEILARSGKIDDERLYPRIEENPEAKALRGRMGQALRDPLLEDLVLKQYPDLAKRMSEEEAWTVALRTAQVTLSNSYAINYQAAVTNAGLRWGRQAGRKNRSTPAEAKNLIAELHWLNQRCQRMYASLYRGRFHKDPPAGWV